MTGRFRLGCALWSHEGWRGDLFPKRARKDELLALYAARLTAVEGNTTFYGVPTVETLARWRDAAPEGFRFCPKLHRDVTHAGPLAPRVADARAFLDRVEALGDRLGPVHVQLPRSYGPESEADLAAFLQAWPRERATAALELRHPGWYEDAVVARVFRELDALGVARVVLDTRPIYEGAEGAPVRQERRKPQVPMLPAPTGPLLFVRYIGHPEPARNETYLDAWAPALDATLRDGRDVYFFAHCPDEDRSPGYARAMQRRLEARGAPVPALPWDSAPEEPEQLELF